MKSLHKPYFHLYEQKRQKRREHESPADDFNLAFFPPLSQIKILLKSFCENWSSLKLLEPLLLCNLLKMISTILAIALHIMLKGLQIHSL